MSAKELTSFDNTSENARDRENENQSGEKRRTKTGKMNAAEKDKGRF